MANILLINPSYKSSYGGSRASIVNPVYPTLGLASIAALPKKNGHNVKILDLCYREYDYHLIKKTIIEFKADVVGISATTPLFNQARDISFLVKDIDPKITVVCGGAHVSSLPYTSMLQSCFDAVFVGEADFSFSDLCDGVPLKEIPGLYIRLNEKIVSTGLGKSVENLDDLPFPAWELYDLKIYEKNLSKLYVRKSPATKIEFSRGCVYKCNFCISNKTLTRNYRKKSPKRCAEELEYAKSLGFKEMLLSDDIFTTDNKWAKEVSDEIINKNIDMLWSCSNGIRVESSNVDLFKRMKEAGCYRVFYGFESGSDEIIKGFGKGGKASVSAGIKAVSDAKEAKLDVGGYFMLGLLGEKLEDVNKTIEYANTLPLDLLKFSITTPFPGSSLFVQYHSKGLIKSYNWDDYHMASEQELFSHETLTYSEIQKSMLSVYSRTMFLNPKFYLNRFVRSLKAGEILSDIYYYFKFLCMPSVGKLVPNNYYAKDRWDKIEIEKGIKIDLSK